VPNVSHNPEYRPSDPPQVGSQQFNHNYGSQPQYGSGQYSQGQSYGDGQTYGQAPGQPYSQGYQGYGQGGYSQPDPYNQQNAYGAYSQPGSYGAYSQPGVYSQPMTYGAPPMIVRPVPNKMAVWAMWMGIVGIGGGFVCGLLSMMPFIGFVFSISAMFLWVAPILAVIFGHIGLSQIKRTGEDGHGQALAGLIMGYVSIALGLLALIVLIGLFGVGFAMMGSYY
jgi:hypothetical protein